eukprot:Rmarinus@m.3789
MADWIGCYDPSILEVSLPISTTPDLLAYIFWFLPRQDVHEMGKVCIFWRDACTRPMLWHCVNLANRDFPRGFLDRPHVQKGTRRLDLTFAREVYDTTLCPVLPSFLHLRSLILDGCRQVSDRLLASLPRQLRRISLYWNTTISDKGMKVLGDQCPYLTHVGLSGCKFITNAGVRALCMRARCLVALDLTRAKIDDDALELIARYCPHLEVLNCYACASFESRGVQVLTATLSRLSSLDLCGCAQSLKDDAFSRLSAEGTCAQALRNLNLSWCLKLTDETLFSLAKDCHNLEVLRIRGNTNITDVGMSVLAQCAPFIRELDVNGCVGIERRTLSELKTMFPRLERLVPIDEQ